MISLQKNLALLDSNMDFLIRFENLEEDFKLLCVKLNILHSPLPKYSCFK